MSDNKEMQNPQAAKIFRSQDFKTIYANFVQGAFTPFDISLLFGGVFPEVTTNAQIELSARVVLSPIEAKLLIRILRGMVLSYEKQFGKIEIPESVNNLSTTGSAVPIPKEEDDSEGD